MESTFLLDQLDFWHWLIFGVALIFLEMLAPGVVFLWLGIAAAVTGGLLYLVPGMGWENQFLIFSVLSVVSVAVGRMWMRRHPTATDRPLLNRRGEQYVGRTFTLPEAIDNGVGKLKVDDTTWKVSGPDLPAGTKVKVVGVDGVVLLIERT